MRPIHQQWIFDESSNIAVLNIPKNGSTSIKKFFPDHQLVQSNRLLGNCKKYVVLRDPVERWYSGIMQYLLFNKIPESLIIEEKYIQTLFDGIVFDEHTMPQTEFMEGTDPDSVHYFWFDRKFTGKWNKHFQGELSHYNVGRDWQLSDGTKVLDRLQEFGQRIVNHRHLRHGWVTIENKVRRFYREDYQLVRSRDYVGGNS